MYMTSEEEEEEGETATLEIKVESAEGLNRYSSYFTRVTPFFTLTKLPNNHVYEGRGEHVFRVPLDPTFFANAGSSLHLQLHNKRRFVGPTKLGSCLIPASDIALFSPLSLRFLSYRLRATDGSRTHLIINLSFRLHGSLTPLPCQTVVGIPVTALRRRRIANATD